MMIVSCCCCYCDFHYNIINLEVEGGIQWLTIAEPRKKQGKQETTFERICRISKKVSEDQERSNEKYDRIYQTKKQDESFDEDVQYKNPNATSFEESYNDYLLLKQDYLRLQTENKKLKDQNNYCSNYCKSAEEKNRSLWKMLKDGYVYLYK